MNCWKSWGLKAAKSLEIQSIMSSVIEALVPVENKDALKITWLPLLLLALGMKWLCNTKLFRQELGFMFRMTRSIKK